MATASGKPKKITKAALQAAQASARAGRIDEAMPTLHAAAEQESASATYSLVEHAQIAPIVVLWHPDVRAMMTPERAQQLLTRQFA